MVGWEKPVTRYNKNNNNKNNKNLHCHMHKECIVTGFSQPTIRVRPFCFCLHDSILYCIAFLLLREAFLRMRMPSYCMTGSAICQHRDSNPGRFVPQSADLTAPPCTTEGRMPFQSFFEVLIKPSCPHIILYALYMLLCAGCRIALL